MRLNVPLLPIVVTVESRPLTFRQPRIRDFLILIAVIAVGLFVSRLGDRAEVYRRRASYHGQKVQSDRWLIDFSRTAADVKKNAAEASMKDAELLAIGGEAKKAAKARKLAEEMESQYRLNREGVELWTKRAEYHRSMESKYGFASRYPWVPLLPDPTEP